MDASGDYFGDQRLGTLVEEDGDLPLDELRERILREIRAFVGAAPQHDDMTMLLLRVEG
jgi:sigma-B regulation protein RsbU (phosphoserine phosphatase)